MNGLSDVTVIVTGAARGQGAAEARRLVAAGARVLIGDVLTHAGQDLADELGPHARFARLDVAEPGDWTDALQRIEDWPAVHGLVNNAGVYRNTPLEQETAEQMARLFAVNVTGAALGMQAVAPAMRANGGGSIVNIGSVLGMVGGLRAPTYTASKWALRGLTRSAAAELGGDRIRVNIVHPGYIETPMLADAAIQRPDGYYSYTPLQRSGTVEEIASLVCFLLSSDSEYLTGADFVADGGMLATSAPRTNFPDLR